MLQQFILVADAALRMLPSSNKTSGFVHSNVQETHLICISFVQTFTNLLYIEMENRLLKENGQLCLQ